MSRPKDQILGRCDLWDIFRLTDNPDTIDTRIDLAEQHITLLNAALAALD